MILRKNASISIVRNSTHANNGGHSQAKGQFEGFFGIRPLIVIGDQPPKASWGECHPSRKLFYGTLIKLGIPDAHLTDVIKRRGRGSGSRNKLPTDLKVHAKYSVAKSKSYSRLGSSPSALVPKGFWLSTYRRFGKKFAESGTSHTGRAQAKARVSRSSCGPRSSSPKH
jgi:hypothetical protein